MCIICNLKDPQNDIYSAVGFLHAYTDAQRAMALAAENLLAVSKLELADGCGKQYDRAHKQMKRVIRAWNLIEHSRECCLSVAQPSAQPSPVPQPK